MTSYLLDRLLGRERPPGPGDCIFCDIIAHRKDAYIIAETPEYAAFLDVLPIRAGHILVVPKAHLRKISELDKRKAAAIMDGVVCAARAMESALKSEGLQVAANQEYAQTIDHVHVHIVPAPTVGGNGVLDKWNKAHDSPILGRRGELTDEEGAEVAAIIRAHWPRRAHL